MALKLLQPGLMPLGQYDFLDSELLSIKGGEVVTFRSLSLVTADLTAADGFDGYTIASGVAKRTVATKTLASGKRPLMLTDDGTVGYGVIFGTIVGGTVGQQVTGGTVLGPHTAQGSGKISLFDKQGLYAVSLDAVDSNASTGLTVTNSTLDTGAALYATTGGILTPLVGSSFESNLVIGRFIEFTTTGSLVTTPSRLVSALNSPSGLSAGPRVFTHAVFHFNPPV